MNISADRSLTVSVIPVPACSAASICHRTSGKDFIWGLPTRSPRGLGIELRLSLKPSGAEVINGDWLSATFQISDALELLT